jgi:tRNA threonylcarbamoyladenosine biosynthesis protein TsaE
MTEQVATPETAARRLDFESRSAADTIRIGHEIAALLVPPKLLILRGTLGAGKTTLVKGIAEAFNAAEADEVTSPTFTLVHEYEGSRTVDGPSGKQEQTVSLYHLDLYRLENERQVEGLGIAELASEDAIVLVEWGEKFPSVLRRAQGEICMESTGGDSRRITLTLKD